jgi:deoxyribonuclease IV
MTKSSNKLLIGAHTSTAGGLHNALRIGREIGATTVQIFTSSQRQWRPRTITSEEVEAWQVTLKETGLTHIMSHDSYLINLGATDERILAQSRDAFRAELERCLLLGLTYCNFHPGAHGTSSPEECLDRIVDSLLEFEKLLKKGSLTLLIENTAGQGTAVGHRFEQLGYLVERLQGRLPVGVCIDTCHAFAAGYDLRTEEDWKTTLKEFDRHVGLSFLKALHVNDSVKPLGSRVDRHAQLGEGQLGMDCFRAMMRHPKLRALPKYLETPAGPEAWVGEIALLRQFADG